MHFNRPGVAGAVLQTASSVIDSLIHSFIKGIRTCIFFFYNKFASGEYVHVHSVVLKDWSLKCSQIIKITPKIHALEPLVNSWYGLLEPQENPANGI